MRKILFSVPGIFSWANGNLLCFLQNGNSWWPLYGLSLTGKWIQKRGSDDTFEPLTNNGYTALTIKIKLTAAEALPHNSIVPQHNYLPITHC